MTYKDELKLIIKAEVDKAIRDLGSYNKATGKAEATTLAFSKAATLVKRTLAAAGLGVSFTVLVSQLNRFAKTASEAEETASKFSVVFGDIADTAEVVARKYASSFDVAESTAKKLLGNVGDLLTGMGASQAQALELSEAVAELGTDLASFTNYAGGASEAVDALTKMMLGEREMVKSLGIVIREADVQQRLLEKGQADLTGTAKLLATAQVSLELATEQSKNSIGDYERTAESTANVNRRLQESFKKIHEQIGVTVNDALTPLKSSLAEFLDTLSAAVGKTSLDSLLIDAKLGNQTIDNLHTTADRVERLTAEYEELRDKTERSTDEQERLEAVMQSLVSLAPSAATGFDQYGNALGISAEKTKEFAQQQRKLSALQLQIQLNTIKQAQLLASQEKAALQQSLQEKQQLYEKALQDQANAPLILDAVEQAYAKLRSKAPNNEIFSALEPVKHLFENFNESLALGNLDMLNNHAGLNYLKGFLPGLVERFSSVDDSVRETTAGFLNLQNQLHEFELKDLQIEQLEGMIDALNGDPTKLIENLEAQIERIPELTDQYRILQESLASGMLTTEDYASALQNLLDSSANPKGEAGIPEGSIIDDFNEQLALIENLSAKYTDFSDLLTRLGIAYDREAAKGELVAETFEKIMSAANISNEEIKAFIETYGHYLQVTADPGVAESITSALEAELKTISQLSRAYHEIGLAYDAAAIKQESVISALEALTATAGITEEQIDSFISTYRKYIKLPESVQLPGITENLEAELESINNLREAYSWLGIEYDVQTAKGQAVVSALSRLASSTDVTSQQLHAFMVTYGKWIEKNAEAATGFKAIKQQFDEFSWEGFTENLQNSVAEDLIPSLNGLMKDIGKQIGSGKINAEPLVNSVIDEGTKMIAAAAGPYAPLVNLAGGILEGLSSAIFATIEAAKQAETALKEASEELENLFTDVLDLESELADQRIEAIEAEMDLLKANRDLRLEILRDSWQRGEITGEEYFTQASNLNTSFAEEEKALENQEKLITGIQDVMDNLQKELDGLSGWTKFWTKAEEKLEGNISSYQSLLDEIAADPDGLSDEEIKTLADKYQIEVPAAAEGADFITSGKQLLLVGDNPGGKERVQVTPVSSPNLHGPSENQGITININAPVYGVDDLYLQLEKAGRKLQKLGRTG